MVHIRSTSVARMTQGKMELYFFCLTPSWHNAPRLLVKGRFFVQHQRHHDVSSTCHSISVHITTSTIVWMSMWKIRGLVVQAWI